MNMSRYIVYFTMFFFSVMWGQDCVDGEVNLGWGDCNDFYFEHSDGCMVSGCYSIELTTELDMSSNSIIGILAAFAAFASVSLSPIIIDFFISPSKISITEVRCLGSGLQ